MFFLFIRDRRGAEMAACFLVKSQRLIHVTEKKLSHRLSQGQESHMQYSGILLDPLG